LDKEELRARKICAWCNFVAECKDCPHREWPSGKWHKKPRWDWKKCQEWRHYLKTRRRKFIEKVRKFLKLHSWYQQVINPLYDDPKPRKFKIIRICTICEKKQEFKKKNIQDKKSKWINID